MQTCSQLVQIAQLQQLGRADSGRFAESGGFQQLQPSDLGLEVGYDAKRNFLRSRKAAGTPSGLPEAAKRGVRTGMASGSVAALPLDVPALHAVQKQHAGSEVRAKAVSWLESDAGKDWLKERSMLFSDQGGKGSASSGHTERPRPAPKKALHKA